MLQDLFTDSKKCNRINGQMRLVVRLRRADPGYFYYLMLVDGFGKPLFDPSLDVGNLIPIVALNCLTKDICFVRIASLLYIMWLKCLLL